MLVIRCGGVQQHGRPGAIGGSRTGRYYWWSPTYWVVGRAWDTGVGGTHNWAVVSWGQYVAPQHIAVLEFQCWAQVVRQFVESL